MYLGRKIGRALRKTPLFIIVAFCLLYMRRSVRYDREQAAFPGLDASAHGQRKVVVSSLQNKFKGVVDFESFRNKLNGDKIDFGNTNKTGGVFWKAVHSIVQLPRRTRKPLPPDCQPLGYSKTALPLTALASFPGSGNTWLRHLIQQATGIYTGSLYYDGQLRFRAFPGEGTKDRSVIAIKSHDHPGKDRKKTVFDRAIVILRDPEDTLRAEYNRRRAGHLGYVVESRFNHTDWLKFVKDLSPAWLVFYQQWIQFDRPVLIIRFEDVRTNLPATLRSLCRFLDVTFDEILLPCIEGNSGGEFHRWRRSESLLEFSDTMRDSLKSYSQTLDRQIKETCLRCVGITD